MINKCPFLNQLRYCYSAADINVNGANVNIRFKQELNIDNGADVIRFLLMPLCELSNMDCTYTININTPNRVYTPYIVSLSKGEASILRVNTYRELVIAS